MTLPFIERIKAKIGDKQIKDGFDFIANVQDHSDLNRVFLYASQEVDCFQLIAELPLDKLCDIYLIDNPQIGRYSFEEALKNFHDFENQADDGFRRSEIHLMTNILKEFVWNQRPQQYLKASQMLKCGLNDIKWQNIVWSRLPFNLRLDYKQIKNGYHFVTYLEDFDLIEKLFYNFVSGQKGKRHKLIGDASVRELLAYCSNLCEISRPFKENDPIRNAELNELRRIHNMLVSYKSYENYGAYRTQLAIAFQRRMGSFTRRNFSLARASLLSVDSNLSSDLRTKASLSNPTMDSSGASSVSAASLTLRSSDSSTDVVLHQASPVHTDISPKIRKTMGARHSPQSRQVVSIAKSSTFSPTICTKATQNNPRNISLETLTIGLPNFGKTCYANAVLQMLNRADSFRNRLCGWIADPSNTIAAEAEFARVVDNILRHMCGMPRANIVELKNDLQLLFNLLQDRFPRTHWIAENQDSHEFFTCLISVLPNFHLFDIGVTTYSSCEQCKSCTDPKRELRNCLLIPISSEWYASQTIHNVVSTMINESLTPKYGRDCYCGVDEIVYMKDFQEITQLPEYLVLMVERNVSTNEKSYKSNECMKVDRKLKLSTTTKNVSEYELVAALHHGGESVNRGHWTCYIFWDTLGWWFIDDEAYMQPTEEQLEAGISTSSVLMYRNMNT